MKISEIERLTPSDYRGGKSYLYGGRNKKSFKPLPGGSGLLYSIEDATSEPTIKLWDPNPPGEDNKPKKMRHEFTSEYETRLRAWEQRQRTGKKELQIIGKLSLEKPYSFPIQGALQVGTITVDEDYRGVGLAKALYGIVLTIMKRPLIAGGAQTPGGRRNWVSLSQIPGVEMKGYVSVDDSAFATDPSPTSRYDHAYNKEVDNRIDTIMGKLGGQYIGASQRSGEHFFAFDVQPTTTGNELEAHIKQKLASVYGGNDSYANGLYAVWTG